MKIRIEMNQLNDTDNEKIRLGIKKIEDYEQKWLQTAAVDNIREIEMSPDEWKQVVEKMPHVDISISGDHFSYPYHETKIIRDDNKVTIQGQYVRSSIARFIIDLLGANTYELYRGPEQPKQPEPTSEQIKETKPTSEQIKETKIRDIEKRIAEEIKAIELAKGLNLPEQVKAHEDELTYFRKQLAVVQADYERAEWEGDKYSSLPLEDYRKTMPLFSLEELQKSQGFFDDFRIWEERDDCDPLLVGRIISGAHKTPYLIAEWR